MAKDGRIPPHTHQASITIYSDSVNPDVWLQIDWEPKLTGEEIQALGYFPPAYRFVQEYIVPLLERIFMENAETSIGENPTAIN